MKKKSPSLLTRLFMLCLTLGVGAVAVVVILVSIIYPKLPSMDELRNYQPKLPLQVYSSDGVLLGQFGQEHRIYVSYDNTPPLLIDAILAAEDERFYKHSGIDYLGVIRAVGLNLTSGHLQSGASTITMQVARNFFLSSQKTFWRKFNEVMLAYKIEKSLTKEQILELYINQIYLGQRAYGFAEASLTYFGKPIDKLSIAEYAILAGLPKAPSAYNPVVNKKRSREREIYVLTRMRALNFITQEQYNQAINQKIFLIKGSRLDMTDSGGYIAEMVRQMLYDKYGDSIYTTGYKVYTTINSQMQQYAYDALRNGVLDYDANHKYRGAEEVLNLDGDLNDDQVLFSAFNGISDYGDLRAAIVTAVDDNKIHARIRNGNEIELTGKDLAYIGSYLHDKSDHGVRVGAVIRVRNLNGKWHISQVPIVEGALVALDPNDGSLRALVGGFDFAKNNYNHVMQAMRQPGSGFKPFIYSAALSHGFNANSIIDDSPVCYPTGGVNNGQWCPRNDERDFSGDVTLRQALAQSLNVVTVKLLNAITPEYAINYMTHFGFAKSQFLPYLTMALGVNEVTPIQMATAYAEFANGGYQVTPYFVKVITDSKGNIIAKTENIDIHSNPPAIDPRNAYVMNSILQDVVRYGTGARIYRTLKRNDLAGKTGTTTDAKDVWFNGYTPNLAVITWVGYDQPQSLGAHAYGATIALPIWLEFMTRASPIIPEAYLKMPPGINVLHNASWKNNDEYVFDDNALPANLLNNNNLHQESVTINQQPTKVNASDVNKVNKPENNNEQTGADNNSKDNKSSSLDQLINSIHN